jgi:hypothetical protein
MAELNPVLCGWEQCSQACNAANHCIDVDANVAQRLKRLRPKHAVGIWRAGQAWRWDREYFECLGLHRLRGMIHCPGKH